MPERDRSQLVPGPSSASSSSFFDECYEYQILITAVQSELAAYGVGERWYYIVKWVVRQSNTSSLSLTSGLPLIEQMPAEK
ncbi:hypothetical protein [Reticulibacter mediterranei]|uniref:hypothetical protein n=1 Tax=Reticulibacter mediterranei TaxID=2778369 RepID=UPI001C68E0F7|nr:hypothetical protein [Reticulibacter mediterranei]